VADAKPKAATVPRKAANQWLSRAIANFQVGKDDKAQAAGEKLVQVLRSAGVISQDKI
jgi:hypothetical protein